MKKLLATIVFISGFLFSKAQQKITYGLAAGVNVSSAKYDYPFSYFGESSKTGFTGNAFVNLAFARGFSLQTEIGYNNFGSAFHDRDNPEPGDYLNLEVSRNYVTLSVLPMYKFRHTSLSIFAGPSVGYLVNTKTTVSTNVPDDEIDLPPLNYQKASVFGILGAGYSLPAGFGVSARYIGGTSNIMGSYQGFEAFQHSFNFTLNYTFSKP